MVFLRYLLSLGSRALALHSQSREALPPQQQVDPSFRATVKSGAFPGG